MRVQIYAGVACTDGPCGRVESVIVDPLADRVTHLVVRGRGAPHVEYLLPLDEVTAAEDDTVHVGRTRAALEALERFTDIIYVDQSDPRVLHKALHGATDDHVRWAEARPGPEMLVLGAEDVPVEHERIPPGEKVLHRSACVVANDGRIAELEAIVIDEGTGRLSGLVMKEGHLWARHEVTLPVAEIARIEDDVIYLRRPRRAAGGQGPSAPQSPGP
jgi:uncharacterized protein YrrD